MFQPEMGVITFQKNVTSYLLLITRAKTNILNESERITFTTNEYLNILSVFSIELLA